MVADILSRWGNGKDKRFAPKTDAKAKLAILPFKTAGINHGGGEVYNHFLVKNATACESAANYEPGTIYEVPKPWQWPCFEDVKKSQNEYKGNSNRKELIENDAGLLEDNEGRVWIPEKDTLLLNRICRASYASWCGHGGVQPTTKYNTKDFTACRQAEWQPEETDNPKRSRSAIGPEDSGETVIPGKPTREFYGIWG